MRFRLNLLQVQPTMQRHDCKEMREEVLDILGIRYNFFKSSVTTQQSSLDYLLEDANIATKLLIKAMFNKITLHSICVLTFSELRWP